MLSRVISAVVGLALLVTPFASSSATGRKQRVDGWYVVTYEQRIRSVDRAALDQIGPAAVTYGPRGSYIAWLDARSVAQTERLPNVRSVAELAPAAKLSDAIDIASHPLLDVTVYLGRAREARGRLEALADVINGYTVDPTSSMASLVVRADPSDLPTIAADPDVLSVGPSSTGIELLDEGAAQIVAGNVKKKLPVLGYRRFLKRLGLSGKGITLAIADSGVDDNHPDLAGRVRKRVDYTAIPDYRDTDGHGTHVAGIAAGSGTGVPGASDPKGFAYGQGIAPAASLLDVGVLGIVEETVGLDDFPPFERASRFASRNGAIGWNASWGSGEGDRAGYTQTARVMDVITRDADWKKPGAQPFTLVFAAGNSGQQGPGAPTEAKNLIAVASSLSHRAGDVDTISSFSSRGPTRDGRFGPTIAAPGEDIVSTRSSSGSVLCNTPPVEPSPLAVLYGVCSGTSMAAPQVAGSTALIAEWWKKTLGRGRPSPAMTKALLVNSAKDMGLRDIPNVDEGWGRVNLRSLFAPSLRRIYVDQSVRLNDAGDAYSLRLKPVNPGEPIKVSLAWSDAPAAPNAKTALVNDLDLRVRTEDGATFWGNRFRAGRSVRAGRPDRREVLENVFIDRASGTYSIRISAADLPGDGVPFTGDKNDQDFALVVTNARRV